MENKNYYRDRARKWREKYPEKYKANNAEKVAEFKQRYHNDPEYRAKELAKRAEYYKKNKESIKARRAANPKTKAAQKEYNDTHKLQHRNSTLMKNFGITLDEYNEIVAEQQGVCWICRKPNNAKNTDGSPKVLYVDHCHKTGKVRGLLCMSCNTAIGHFKDNTEILARAAEYLMITKISEE